MWIIQEPKKVSLWNKRHFEEEKTDSMEEKTDSMYICWINKEMQHLEVRGAALGVKWLMHLLWTTCSKHVNTYLINRGSVLSVIQCNADLNTSATYWRMSSILYTFNTKVSSKTFQQKRNPSRNVVKDCDLNIFIKRGTWRWLYKPKHVVHFWQ